ncbi:MAG: serine/threonine-protein kinase [Myxococcota bacterium]
MGNQAPMSGRFKPIRLLAEGGMGSVELVVRHDEHFSRPFVVKRPRGLASASRAMLEEARIGGLLGDSRVVPILDVGTDERGVYILMEYVEGGNLAELLRRLGRSGETLSVEAVAYMAEQLGRGLHAAHELVDPFGTPIGLVHRDVSPQNVMLGFDGRVRLMDFGIALADGREGTTREGFVRGKPGYLSPEQLTNGAVDRRADIYALGIVTIEALITDRVFQDRSTLEAVVDFHDFRTDVPPGMEELLLECIAGDPRNRPATSAEFADRIHAFVGNLRVAENEVATVVRREFSERRDTLRREIASALGAAPVVSVESQVLDDAARIDETVVTHTADRPRTRASRLAVAAIALLLGLAAAALWAQRTQEGSESATSISTAPAKLDDPRAPARLNGEKSSALEDPASAGDGARSARKRDTRKRRAQKARGKSSSTSAVRPPEKAKGEEDKKRPTYWDWPSK